MKCLVVVLVCALARIAVAQPALAVEYKAPDDCVHLPAIRADVAAKLGRDPFAAEASRRAIIEIWHTARGYFAQIDLSEAAQSTKHQSVGPFDTCAEATNALGDALVKIIDPMHDESPHFTPHPEGSSSGGRPPNSVTIRIEPTDEPKHEIGLVVGSLYFPGPAIVAGITAGYRFPNARASVTARFGTAEGNVDGATRRITGSELLGTTCAKYEYVEACANLGFGLKGVSQGESGVYFLLGAALGVDIPIGRAYFVRAAFELDGTLPEPAAGVDAIEVGGHLTVGKIW
ncbi:MAG: hypothetical protein QM831_26755 [Kofleriaceae bacterium]